MARERRCGAPSSGVILINCPRAFGGAPEGSPSQLLGLSLVGRLPVLGPATAMTMTTTARKLTTSRRHYLQLNESASRPGGSGRPARR